MTFQPSTQEARMSLAKPALSLAAVPGRRQRTLQLATEIEQRGYAGIYCPSLGDGLALSQGIAHVTERIPFGTSVQPIYYRQPEDYAQTVAFINELAPGAFPFRHRRRPRAFARQSRPRRRQAAG